MKTALFLMTFVSVNAFASGYGPTVQSFTVVRSGGGELEAVVAAQGDSISVTTTSCSFKQLTADEQAKTVFTLSGKTLADAKAILANKATLASDQSITGPVQTGTWSELDVTYTYPLYDNGTKSDVAKISAPIVIIGSKLSSIVQDIEAQARTASSVVCKQQ